MNYDPIHNLQRLARIEPDRVFVRRTRRTLTGPAVPITSWFAPARVAFAVAFVFLIAVISAIAPLSFSNRGIAPSLAAESLNREFDNLSIAITLDELAYDYPSNRAIAKAVNELTDTTSHLSGEIIESEAAEFESETTGDEINTLINEIIR